MAKARDFRIRPHQFSLMLSDREMALLKERAQKLGTKPSFLLREYIGNMAEEQKVS